MFLPETVSDQTSQFPALPATAWCSGQCTEPRDSTWPALQPYSRSKCPSPTWGSAQVTWTSSPLTNPSCLSSCKCYYEFLGKALRPLPLKANKNYHKHMFSQRDQTLTSALCTHPSVYGKQGLCWRELCLQNHSSSLLSVYAKYGNSTGPQAVTLEMTNSFQRSKADICSCVSRFALVFPGAVRACGHLSG